MDEHDEAVLCELAGAVEAMLSPIDAEAAALAFERSGNADAALRARRGLMDLTVGELLAACIAQGRLPAIFLCSPDGGSGSAELFAEAARLGRATG